MLNHYKWLQSRNWIGQSYVHAYTVYMLTLQVWPSSCMLQLYANIIIVTIQIKVINLNDDNNIIVIIIATLKPLYLTRNITQMINTSNNKNDRTMKLCISSFNIKNLNLSLSAARWLNLIA